MNVNIRKPIFVCLAFFCVLFTAYGSGNFSARDCILDDSLGIVVTQNSTFLMPGQELEIKVFATCNSKNKISRITIGGAGITLKEDGVAIFRTAAGSMGQHTIPVDVFFVNKDGDEQRRVSVVSYTVGQACAMIALEKMNALYIGVDNITWVYASGATEDKLTVSIKGGGGTIEKISSGKYNLRVTAMTDECTVYVSVDGKLAGASRFKVYNLPVPTASIGSNISGATINVADFSKLTGVSVYLKDFPFEVKYKVMSYRISIGGEDRSDVVVLPGNDAMFPQKVKESLKQHAKPNKLIVIDKIVVKDTGGRSLSLPALIYYVK